MEDERQEELDCIAAIFPEIQFDTDKPFSAAIELPVNPAKPVKVLFPTPSDGQLPTPPSSTSSEDKSTVRPENVVDSQDLSYLPSLQLHITLPEGYPESNPPIFTLATTPRWLSEGDLDELQKSGEQMWKDGGGCQIVYGYIDSLQQAAENAFGYAEPGKILEMPQDLKISLLDYDIKATQAAFEKETFECGVCLDPKKGSVCHRMIDCGHVFCVQCLQDFYNNAINEGDIVSIQCLSPGCAKKRGEEQVATKKHRKPKTQLSPSELLQIPLEPETVTRYVKLKHKAQLESDKDTVYCPRKWCQGAAKSKKHRKPNGVEDEDSAEEESDNEQGKKPKFIAGKDLLSICEDCSYAFCSRCYQGWHGEFISCTPPRNDVELTAEEKASLEYVQLHTTPCPTCAAPSQKTHGCNHMICFRCNSHFCYLCSAWLSPSNPYSHYNDIKTGCFQRLWELEGGDGDEVGIDGNARVVQRNLAEAEAAANAELFAEEPVPEPEPAPIEAAVPRQALQREGPLVLRINHVPPPPPPAVVVEPAAQPRRNPPARNRNPRAPGQNVRNLGQAVNARVQRQAHAAARRQARDGAVQDPAAQEAAHQAWVRMFVQMALNDEEDQVEWDSDDEVEDGAWEIPVR